MTSQEFANLWARRSGNADAEMQKTVRRLAERCLAVSLKHMKADIYAKPVDASSTGRPKWKRTEHLRQHERAVIADDGLGFSLVNDMPYAAARHALGGPESRKKTTRPAPWRDEMKEEMRDEIPQTFFAMNRRILTGGS